MTDISIITHELSVLSAWFWLTFLEFQQQYADGEEDHHPDAGRYEARVDDWLADRPAALRDRAQALGRLGQRQEVRHVLEARIHAFDGPNDAAQHDDGQKASHCHVRCGPFVFARRRNDKTCLFGCRSMKRTKRNTHTHTQNKSIMHDMSQCQWNFPKNQNAVSTQNSDDNSPKHMPHRPVKIVSKMTSQISPFNVKPKIEKLKSSTNVVWPHIITNCVVTCDSRISMPVMPDTRHRSSMPSLRSMSMAPDVSATDKKKMMVRMTPGAAKSVKFGVSVP